MLSSMNFYIIFLILIDLSVSLTPEDEGVKYANKCEACKILAIELEARLRETGSTKEKLEIGYSVDQPKVKKDYVRSELRLIESLDGVCDRVLEYNIHKEREDSSRFSKGMSQTFQTLHGLVDKGVKVDLGIPYELWDKPSAEITNMKTQCETMVEEYEEIVEDWYQQGMEKPLSDILCRQRVLADSDSSCLDEKGETASSKKPKQKKKKASDEKKEEL